MKHKTRIGIIHATQVSMKPIDCAFKEIWPEVETANFLDDSLSVDRADHTSQSDALDDRIRALANYSLQSNCSALLYACSAFGSAIESVAAESQLPVLKPNEAMFESALVAGSNIAMLYSFEPACKSMEAEFRQEAIKRNLDAHLTSIFVPDAMNYLRSGDASNHNKLIAESASKLEGFDAIILAHFSMSQAAIDVRTATSIPVLTSPDAAVIKLKKLMIQNRG